MDYRKLIKFGNSSYVVSLPKEWINKNSLKKGDVVYFNENGNSELVVSLNNKEINEVKRIVLDVSSKDANQVERELVSMYIAGYDLIKIKGDNLRDSVKSVKQSLEKLVGMEIIEQTSKQIVIKNLLDNRKVSVKNLIKRMNIIIRSMIEDSKLCYKEKNCESLHIRDQDVNRLSILIFRIIKKALSDPYTAKSLNMNPSELNKMWALTFFIEKIADNAKRIGRYIETKKYNKENIARLLELYSLIESEYIATISSYYKEDKDMAFKVSSRKDQIMHMCDELANKYVTKENEHVICKLKEMESDIHDISRLVYQYE